MEHKRYSKGFTLIEIVLVLAIAGLIMVVVFLAVQGAQRSRRDYQRKDDLAHTVAAITAWASNHKGQVPLTQADMDDVNARYMGLIKDPLTGAPYNLSFRAIGSPHSDIPALGDIYYQQAHWCNRGPSSNPDSPTDPIAGDDTSTTKFVDWPGSRWAKWRSRILRR
jgi:prepilin-type N-terminal cleavage/methylation domain-containing protein